MASIISGINEIWYYEIDIVFIYISLITLYPYYAQVSVRWALHSDCSYSGFLVSVLTKGFDVGYAQNNCIDVCVYMGWSCAKSLLAGYVIQLLSILIKSNKKSICLTLVWQTWQISGVIKLPNFIQIWNHLLKLVNLWNLCAFGKFFWNSWLNSLLSLILLSNNSPGMKWIYLSRQLLKFSIELHTPVQMP